jgi:hypothetical protein
VAMTTPWNIMDQLQNWASILQDHIDRLTLSAEKTKQLQNESKLNPPSRMPGDVGYERMFYANLVKKNLATLETIKV